MHDLRRESAAYVRHSAIGCTKEARKSAPRRAVRVYARLDQVYARRPVALARSREFARLRWNRDRRNESASGRRAEHERPAEEAHEVVLLAGADPRSGIKIKH
jgi:hypothetical protein